MKELSKDSIIGVIGAGTMGSGIAQIASTFGHHVTIIDNREDGLLKAEASLQKIMKRLVEKGRIEEKEAGEILGRIRYETTLPALSKCDLVIEAIIEDLNIKEETFSSLEDIVSGECILATNTSSLSIAAIGAACSNPGRVLGVHFFNPAPLMPLVEIVPGISTREECVAITRKLIDQWGKVTVLAKDTPGFIVNRVARPFYGEALRILEEGMGDAATIDYAMKEIGGFRMGPFELMDFIGNDVNYTVTETVFEAFFYEPRYRPSFTQKRMTEAGLLGRKSGKGYYEYTEGASQPEPNTDPALANEIFIRILSMLINEAVDAAFLNVATPGDIDLAMTKGVNYPKGLLTWANELGLEMILDKLTSLQEEYGEDRYRPSPLLKRMVRDNQTFEVGAR